MFVCCSVNKLLIFRFCQLQLWLKNKLVTAIERATRLISWLVHLHFRSVALPYRHTLEPPLLLHWHKFDIFWWIRHIYIVYATIWLSLTLSCTWMPIYFYLVWIQQYWGAHVIILAIWIYCFFRFVKLHMHIDLVLNKKKFDVEPWFVNVII